MFLPNQIFGFCFLDQVEAQNAAHNAPVETEHLRQARQLRDEAEGHYELAVSQKGDQADHYQRAIHLYGLALRLSVNSRTTHAAKYELQQSVQYFFSPIHDIV